MEQTLKSNWILVFIIYKFSSYVVYYNILLPEMIHISTLRLFCI